jgi:hypothetical protein
MLVDCIHTNRNLKLCNLFIDGYEINKYKLSPFTDLLLILLKAFSIQDPQ